MSHFWLTAYVLIWPIMAAVVLVILTVGVVSDLRRARRRDESVV